MAVKNCFIRGSVVRYVQLPAEHVDTQLLEDATRRGMCAFKSLFILVTQSLQNLSARLNGDKEFLFHFSRVYLVWISYEIQWC